MSPVLRVKYAWIFAKFGPNISWPIRFTRYLVCGIGGHGKLYRFFRYLEGARPTVLGNYEETCGMYQDDKLNVEVEFYGACPVQGDGFVDELPCYYRSRGEGWQFSVAASPDSSPLDETAWEYYESSYFWPDGGWVHRDVSRACIEKAVKEYRRTNGRA